ncbi:MAG: hypothetical protein JOZ73_07185 [Solirubrobacterales bacterium]|nr:hypothetical protein [Solirubrobacterales bacterium]
MRALVLVSALLAADAVTTSLRWAADIACANGAEDVELAEVLLTIAPTVGMAQTVRSAPRLALALGVDLETDVSASS